MKRSILLVEDNPVDLDLTLRAFRRRDVENPIDIARDGEEALAWLDRWELGTPTPTVILLDLKLPKIGGLEVLGRMKSHPTSSVIPVVVMTASDDDGAVQAAYGRGANSYIVKPVNFDEFLDVVDQIHTYWCRLNIQLT